ncbi:MAG: O-antigen ligase family protein, partial [Cyanobacteriota bacterium SKYGB_h_bin112]|nr:O-antigen ligase family protein [Cyanobacteriota bacterium SKYGB_h_bin112]
YGWAALCGFAALYALNQYLCHSQYSQLTSPETSPHTSPSDQSSRIYPWPLLAIQASLNLAFILTSLWLWVTQTWWPELSKLQQLQASGAQLSFDLSILELRNWAPIGHQNYVAGYLLLAIPLLAGLALTQVGWQRWLWVTATGLGLVDLYTTNSRGGWLGLLVAVTVVGSLWLWQRQRWLIGVGLVPIAIGLVFVNERLRGAIVTLLRGQSSGELAFRAINTVVGWRIGLDHPWLGAGLGSVPLLYQRYRPIWAGREAELAYQLHSTPIQLWAELGLWGVVTAVSVFLMLAYLSLRSLRQHHPLTISLLSGLLAYSVMALTDYQLDNLSISGTIVLYVALLASQYREQAPKLAGTTIDLTPSSNHRHLAPKLALATVALLIAASLWLWPIHYAWSLSSQGFAALNRQDFTTFSQRLEQAQRWAPWEPYYPNQLGWVVGNVGLETKDPKAIQVGIRALQRSLAVAPDQEFASTNLGWLLMTQDPQTAMGAFLRSAQLAPAKRGIFYRLGMSLIAQGKTNLAITAFTLELLRDP